MNEKIIKLTELCARSKWEGLTYEEHQIKKALIEELITDGLMYKDTSCNWFINESDAEYFTSTISNWVVK